ncbi:2Fe-2S iron-sulfur cluster-binding protein [Aeoliella straminimaris]|uniref:2Fe-2S iron-sulfur cluster-binding protein n=1 Tax=Aeoliella straminimaris TaxID=2954799 RepID=UPI0021BC6EA9|nr:2Fe-2S iron-sulfur cluster-binding protein [Aeoliella straminimaris]
MVQVWIDNVSVEVPHDATVLQAARKLGIDLPAMCSLADHDPNTSCMCCLVRVDGSDSFVPSCATNVREGMQVESETREVHALRKTGIELLLADHAGDCHAPCQNTCPAKMDIPNMLRLVADGDYLAALATVKRDIALPAILGRVCPEVCEQACRRGQHDSPAAICKIKRFVADRDLESSDPYRPELSTDSGKRVAIVGAGPTGLTAAYHLRQCGHRCTLIDSAASAGGRLQSDFASELPADVLQAEVSAVLSLDVDCQWNQGLASAASLDVLLRDYDAVLLATGRGTPGPDVLLDVERTKSGLRVDAHTRMTSREGLFAAGNAVRPYKLVVQSVAEGKLAAECIDGWLRGALPPDRRHAYETRLARLTNQELCDFCDGAVPTPRVDGRLLSDGASEDAARSEAERCLECDCRALASCLLHHYASMYDCDAQHYRGEGRRFEGRLVGNRVTLEQGKCILCGICVQLAAETSDAAGLAVVHRGVDTRLAPPPGSTIDEALGSAASKCAEACPTGAIITAAGR